jgi:hypothetical protein
MALGCGLTSVRATEEKIMKNEPMVRQQHKKKKTCQTRCNSSWAVGMLLLQNHWLLLA